MSKILYIPVVRRLFDAPAADQIFTQMVALLKPYDALVPAHNLGTPEEMGDYLASVNHETVSGIIFHNTSFTGAEFIEVIHRYFPTTPILLVASKEPEIGTGNRLHLNGGVGLISTANSLAHVKQPYDYILGDPSEAAVQAKVASFAEAVTLQAKLATLKIGVVGTFPPGFAFAGTDEAKLTATFGTKLLHYEVSTAFQAAEALPAQAYAAELAYGEAHIKHLDPAAPETIKYVQFVTLMKQWAKRDGFAALASRCWPDFFDDYKAAPGAVWSQLCDEGLPTAMECDIHGALGSYILQAAAEQASGQTDFTPTAATYMGDVSTVDTSDNSISMWHDYGAFAMANPKYGVENGVHMNRKIPVSPQFVLKPGPVTLLRVHQTPTNDYEFVVVRGTALDVPLQWEGVSARIQLASPAPDFFDAIVKNGWEQHYSVVYGDVLDRVSALGRVLGIPVHAFA